MKESDKKADAFLDENASRIEAALMPCPFCGHPAEVEEYGEEPKYGQHEAVIGCTFCGTSRGGNGRNPYEAMIDAVIEWNTRKSGQASPL